MKQVTIHTDGACRGNPGPGGWGALLRFGEQEREIFGGEPATTNNRMELTAAIKALEALREPCAVELYTDSKYLMDGITQWLDGWKARGWKTSARKPVKNKDLWQSLDSLVDGHSINWHWVKGHAGHADNERADLLANQGLDDALERFAE